MPSICVCPECRERIMVESLDDPVVRLACPLCSATFDVAAVIDGSEPAPPLARPAVIDTLPPDSPATEEAIAATMAGEEVDDAIAPDKAAPTTAPAADFGSIAAAMTAMDDSMVATAGNDSAKSEATQDSAEPAEETSGHEITVAEGSLPEHRVSGPRVQSRAEDEAPLVIAPPEGGEVDAYSLAGTAAAVEPTEDEQEEDASPAWNAMGDQDAQDALRSSVRMYPRERPVGFLGHLLGVILGGAIGIGLGYLALIWIAGRQGDFLQIWDKIPSLLRPSEHLHL